MSEKIFGQWNITSRDLENISPIKVRDLIIECVYRAQKKTLLRIKHKLDISSNEKEIKEYVKARIKMAFDEVGGDFEYPTRESLTNVVIVVVKMSTLFGTPKNIVEHHKGQMQRLIKALYVTGKGFQT